MVYKNENDNGNKVDPSLRYPTPPYYFPRRLLLVILGFLGLAIAYIIRVLISTAIMQMSEEFHWDKSYQGILLSSFFMGYIITQLPAQYFNDRFGGKRTLLVGLTLSIASTLLVPVAAHNKGAVVVVRIFTGIAQGITFPTMNWLISRWFPASQRSSSAASIWSGVYVGTIFSDFVSPIILEFLHWQPAFYIFGGAGLFWSILWLIFIRDHPKDVPIGIHPNEVAFIAHNEEQGPSERSPLLANSSPDDFFQPNGANLIQESRPITVNEEPELPYLHVVKTLLCSRGLLTLLYFNLVTSWGFYLLLMWYPTYLGDQLGYSTGTRFAFFNALPYMLSFCIGNASGIISDKLLARGVKKIYIRKAFGLGSSLLPGIFLFLAAFCNVDKPAKIVFLTIVICSNGFSAAGSQMVTLDLSPRYAGITMGIGNTVSTIPGILGPLVAGILLQAFQGSWVQIFSMSAAFYVSGGIVWLFLAKCDKVI